MPRIVTQTRAPGRRIVWHARLACGHTQSIVAGHVRAGRNIECVACNLILHHPVMQYAIERKSHGQHQQDSTHSRE